MATKDTQSKFHSCNCIVQKSLYAGVAVTLCLVCFNGRAEDGVAAFRITDIEGHVELRYREDKQDISSGAAPATEKRTSTDEEFFILTHGYIYHPKFLKFDFGGGPLFTQTDLQTTSSNASTDSNEYNLTARLSFLEDKPYPLVLYYDKYHPSIALSVTDRFEQDSEKYGFDFKLRPPLWPVSLTLGASRHETQGQGFNTRIDNVIDEASANLEMALSKGGYAKLSYNTTDSVSRSGFIDQPILTQQSKTNVYNFDSHNTFGERQQFQLTNVLSYVERKEIRPLEEIRYAPELRWTHSDDLSSFYRLNYSDSDQVTVQTTTVGAASGFRYKINEQSNTSAEMHYESNETTGLDLTNYGASGFVNYQQNYSDDVTLQLNAGLNYDYFDRVVTQNIQVRGLSYTLLGSASQFLVHDNIVRSTIRVYQMLGGSETELVVGVDTVCGDLLDPTDVKILVQSIGARTTIENCDGAIDGDIQVRLDYEYDAGGTVAYSSILQSYQANLQLYQHYNLYARYSDRGASVKSGTPTLALGESSNSQFGAKVDYPLYQSVSLGGEVTIEEEDGTLLSYERKATDAYVQFGFFNGVGRLSTRKVNIDYLGTSEDVELVRHSLRFRFRPWNRIGLTAEMSEEEDTGGSTNRRTRIKSMQADWRVRKFILLGEARFVEDVTGTSDRERSLIRISMRRDF